jgi:hypothetical protein
MPNRDELERIEEEHERLTRRLRVLKLEYERLLEAHNPQVERERRRKFPRGDFWSPEAYRRAFPRDR